MEILTFLFSVVIISLSGVMAPGPVTTASITMGLHNRFAGSLIAVGHGIVEMPLIVLITLGAGTIFQKQSAQVAIGFAGGAMLLFMAFAIFKSAKESIQQQAKPAGAKPVIAGIVLSAGNPYFLVWWATVGLVLASKARAFGIWAFAVFALTHWLCDLIWYQALSWSAFKGSVLLGGRNLKTILQGCSAAMFLFGAKFIFDASCLLFPAFYYSRLH